jgi:hypothetical protein
MLGQKFFLVFGRFGFCLTITFQRPHDCIDNGNPKQMRLELSQSGTSDHLHVNLK